MSGKTGLNALKWLAIQEIKQIVDLVGHMEQLKLTMIDFVLNPMDHLLKCSQLLILLVVAGF